MVDDDARPSGLIDDHAGYWLEISSYVILSGSLSLLGCLANLINIVVFIKQGFNQSITTSLLGLAISDLGSLATLLWMSVCVTPDFRYHFRLQMDTKSIQYLTAGWPHVCFARISSYITAFITFERCMCIALPLKVKSIITPKRTFIINVTIYIVMIVGIAPFYFTTKLTMIFDETVNTSILSFRYLKNGPQVENGVSSFNVFAQISSFVIVIVCTVVLVSNLSQKGKWRQSASSSTIEDSATAKDKTVMKMVTVVAIIFLACYLPSAANLIAMIFAPEYDLYGVETHLFIVVWGFLNTLEATNSSVNIFIYYRMSSKYREIIHKIFCSKPVIKADNS